MQQRIYQASPSFDDGASTSDKQPAPRSFDGRGLRYSSAMSIVGASAAWLAVSTAIILVNRHIMVDLHFEYPMAVSALGMTCSALFAFVVCDVLRLVPPPDPPLDARFYALRIFPLGLIQAMCLYLSNQLYLLLTVAFIEMSKATMPLFTMAALYMAGLESPNPQVALAVTFTALGCGVAAYGEVRLTASGLLFTMSSLSMESMRMVMTQFLLVGCSFHALQGLKYIAPACVVCLGLGSLIMEWPAMAAAGAGSIVLNHLPMFMLSACLGVVVNMLGLLIIKIASATTLKVLAAVRGPIIVMAGVFIFIERVTLLQFMGYSLALGGFVWYYIHKTQQVAVKGMEEDTDSGGRGGAERTVPGASQV